MQSASVLQQLVTDSDDDSHDDDDDDDEESSVSRSDDRVARSCLTSQSRRFVNATGSGMCVCVSACASSQVTDRAHVQVRVWVEQVKPKR